MADENTAIPAEKDVTVIVDPSSADLQNPDPDTGEPSPPKPDDRRKIGAEERIGQLTKKVHTKDQEAAYWKGRAEAAETRSTPAARETPAAKELDRMDFDSDASYLKAIGDQVKQEVRDDFAREMEGKAGREKQAALQASMQEARDKYEDFDAVALSLSVPITQTMLDAASGKSVGDVLYALGSEPAEAARIASLPPIQQIKEIGKIESRLTKTKGKKQTSVPDPPKMVSGGGASPTGKSEEEMSRSELHSKWEKERLERIKSNYG